MRSVTPSTRTTPPHGEEGDTLLEVLLALLVVGLGAVAILLAFSTSITGSSDYRTLSSVDTVLRSAAESATSQIQQQPASAWACSPSTTDATAVAFTSATGYVLPAGYTSQPLSVQYWNPSTSAFTSTCVANTAQLVQLTITYQGVNYSISFVVDDPQTRPISAAGAAKQLAFIGQPGSTITGSSISPPPVVAVEDAAGNIVTSDLSPVDITIKPGTGAAGATLSSDCSGIEFYGVVTFSNCSISTLGTGYELTATDGTLTSATSTPFDITPAPASQLVFSKVPTGSQTASPTASSGAYQVQEQDLYGNAITATSPVTVNLATSSPGTTLGGTPFFSLSTGGSTLSAITSVTIPTGSSTSPSFYYSDTLAGTPTLTASNPTLIDATTTSSVAPTAAVSLVFTTPPPTTTSTSTHFTVVVTEEDAYGNAETGDSTTNVTLTATAGSNFTCSTHSPARLSSGSVTFSNCDYPTSGSLDTLTASSGSLTPATATTTVVGPASKLVYNTAPPSSVATGAPFSVVVAEEDAAGNVEAGDSATSLSLAANHGGGGFSCSTSPTRVTNGVATYSGCSYTIASATPYTLTASSGFLTSATATTSVVSTPSKLVFTTAPPTSTEAGSSFNVVVAEQDAFGNTVTTDSSTAVTLAANNGGGGFSCAVAPTQVTNGIASYSGCTYTIASATAYTLTASSGSLTPAAASTTVAGTPTRLTYSTPPPTSTSAGTTFTVVVTEQDGFGNTETTDSTTSVSLSANNGGGGFACGTSPTHVTNGVATYSNCAYTVSSVTPYTLTAAATSLTSASATTTVSIGSPSKLVYTTAPPTSVSAGGTFSVVVAEQDAYGNTQTADSSTSIALGANNGGGGFSCSSAPAHVTNGVATYTGCKFTVASGAAYTLSATSSSLASANASVTVSPASATKLVYTTAPPSSTSAGAAFSVVVAVQDTYGNTETGDSSTALTLSASGGSFSCSVAPTQVTNGVATYTGCKFTIASGSAYTVTAAAGSLTPAVATTNVSVGSPAKLVYTTAPPTSTTAGSTFAVVVAEQDTYGNVETGDSSTTLSLAAGGGFSCATTPTHVTNGVASYAGCSFTVASGSAYTVTASSGSLTPATSTTSVSPGAATTLVYSTAPPATTTTGSTFTVVVTEKDAFGNTETADSATAVALAASNGGGGFSCTTTPTHVTNGVATYIGCKYTVASATPYTLTASSSGLSSATATTQVVGPKAKLAFTAPPPAATSAGTTFSVTVGEEDAFGNVETTDSATNLALGASGGGFSCTSNPTHVTNGVATYTGCSYLVASTSPFTLTASSTGLTSATAPTTVSAGAATKLVYTTAPPSSTTAGTAFGVVVTEEDAYNNIETTDSSTVVALAASNGGGGFSCTTAPSTVTNGVASFAGCTYTVASPTAFTLTASSGALASATSTTTVSPSTAKKLVFTTPPPTTTAAGATFSVVVAEQDTYGNTLTADSSTTLSVAATGGSFSCTTTPTHVTNGVATYTGCDYTVASGSPYTLTASSGSLTPATATTAVTAGTVSKLVYTTAPPASTTVGSSFSVVVAAQDAYGNLESGDSSTPVSLSANDGGGGFSCTVTPAQVTNGIATFTGCSYTKSVGSPYTLSATSGSLTPATATTVVAHGVISKIGFTTAPQIIERSTASGTITVQVQDSYGNPVPAPAGGYTVTLTTSSGGGTFTPTSVAIAAGTSSASFTYKDTTAGSPTLTAKIAALPNPTATQVETILGGAGAMSVSVGAQAPATLSAGGTGTFTATVTNSSFFSTHDYTITSIGGLPAGASLTAPTCITVSDFGGNNTGTITLSVPTSTTTPGGTSSLAVVATAYSSTNGSCTGTVSATAQGTATLAVTATAAQLSFVQQPSNVAHNATMTPAVTVLAVDDNFDPVSGVSVTVTLASGPGTLIGGGSVSTAATGLATFNGLKISAAGTGDTLAAGASGVPTVTSQAFNVT